MIPNNEHVTQEIVHKCRHVLHACMHVCTAMGRLPYHPNTKHKQFENQNFDIQEQYTSSL